MKPNNSRPDQAVSGCLKWLGVLLAAVLLLLFHRSLLPGEVHFSNDAPLGAMNTRAMEMPSAFLSVWHDLTWLGQNSGSFLLPLTGSILWLLGPVGYAKFDAAIVLFLLGCSAGLLFRQMRLAPLACVLGGLAAALNSDALSTACWGVATHPAAMATSFLALAAVTGCDGRRVWIRLALAGLAVGWGVMESADIGAIFSLFVAAYVMFQALASEGPWIKRITAGIGRVLLIAVFAAFISAQSLNVLTGINIKGVAGAEQTEEAKAGRWDWATQWSLPKREALSLVVAGLFGYRMDTPDGGNYWGAVGRDAAWDRYFASDRQGPPPNPGQRFLRYTGGGIYAGVLVVLVAVWAVLQSFCKENSVFTPPNRKLLWFWLGVMVFCLLLAFGRYAPFYQFFYALPHASTIRNPAKFIHVFSWALVIVFAYGIHGLSRRHLEIAAVATAAPLEHLRGWWSKARGFDRKWGLGCALAVGASALGWLVFVSARPKVEAYLQTVLFDEGTAKAIAGFSLRQVLWYLLFLALAVGLVLLIVSGWFAGRRAKWGGVLLGVLLVADLGRANLPWIVYWNYKEKYATNPVLDLLRDKAHEHRVTILPLEGFLRLDRLPREAMPLVRLYEQLRGLYDIEWKQHLFLYYNIQCLDIIQEPRVATDKLAYEAAIAFPPLRRWELTNTRYLLAPAALLELFNRQMDPVQQRFRIAAQFDIAPKPGISSPSRYDHLTAVLNTNGQYAVWEFTGALPRAKLYAQWQVSTNAPAQVQDWLNNLRQRVPPDWSSALAGQTPADLATLKQLSEPAFDPAQTVLLAEPLNATPSTNQSAGTVEFESYAPKHVVLRANAQAPAVLLLNDRFDPNWQVRVDGKPETLLRANYIMRGVFVPAGEHRVELRFAPPLDTFYVSLGAMGVGVILLGWLVLSTRRETPPPS